MNFYLSLRITDISKRFYIKVYNRVIAVRLLSVSLLTVVALEAANEFFGWNLFEAVSTDSSCSVWISTIGTSNWSVLEEICITLEDIRVNSIRAIIIDIFIRITSITDMFLGVLLWVKVLPVTLLLSILWCVWLIAHSVYLSHSSICGGGVCAPCKHNTEGNNYWKDTTATNLNHSNLNTHVPSVTARQRILAVITIPVLVDAKRTGHECRECSAGYTAFPECTECECHYFGTLNA